MEQFKSQPANRYYATLGLDSDASPCAIRAAYKKLAMKWHPDKCSAKDRAEANLKFQEIQEAYAVLSDDRKKMLYDSGLYSPDDDEEDTEGFSSFLSEMMGMMANVQDAGKANSLEDLQQLFFSMFSADLAALNNPSPPAAASVSFEKKRGWGSGDYGTSYFESCVMEETFPSPQSHYFFDEAFDFESNISTSTCKKSKSVASELNLNACNNGFSNKGGKGFAGLHTNTYANGFHMNMHDNEYDGSAI
ncbi:hypothetical protein L7F22_032978 [Adiantum nelumboides]|nr:hypothetical protein [Adiantum nelumboides]